MNRAVPVSGLLPELYYRDAAFAIAWLEDVFGFQVHYIVPEDDGGVHTAQLHLGNAYIMVRNERNKQLSPATADATTQQLMVIVDDVAAHYAHAVAAEVRVTSTLTDQVYGEREYSALDLDGHRWTFAQHIADVDPIEMFGTPDQ